MNEPARYAAACALDVSTGSLYNDTVLSISTTVGHLMAREAKQAREGGRDFWPVDGAEYAAEVLNQYAGDPEDEEAIALLTARAVYHAMIGGASEGNQYSLWDKA